MQVKKKASKQDKDYRKLKEAEKAQLKTVVERAVVESATTVKQKTVSKTLAPTLENAQDERYKLPIAEIKADLVKNILYVAGALVFLVILQRTNFGVEQVRQLLKF